MATEPTYVGLDPSLNGTGVCFLDGAGFVQMETILPGVLRGAARLSFIKESFLKLCGERRPTFVAIENYSYDSVGRVFQLGEVGGVLRVSVFELGVTYAEVAPKALKKFATGRATADKPAVIAAVTATAKKEGWPIDPADDNQADACVLAMIAKGLIEGLRAPTRAQLEVLHTIKHPQYKPVVRVRKRIKNFL
jgi:Holliday junction resolvasome RuvABC endonuclease subunit